jgi:hypothetical protein
MPLLHFQRQLVEQVDLALEEIKSGGNSVGIALIGPSGSGKTHGIDAVAERMPPYGEGPCRVIPLVRGTASALNGPPALARMILTLHEVSPEIAAKARNLERAAAASMDLRGTNVIALEEMGDALTKGDSKLKAGAAAALKWLWNANPEQSTNWTRVDGQLSRLARVVLISGTEVLEHELHRDPELFNRFGIIIRTSHLDLTRPGDSEPFREIALDMARRCGLPDTIGERDGRRMVALFLATGADLRKLEKLLTRTATLRKRAPSKTIDVLLDEAYLQVQSPSPVAQGLFTMQLEELKQRFASLTKAKKPQKTPRKVRKT